MKKTEIAFLVYIPKSVFRFLVPGAMLLALVSSLGAHPAFCHEALIIGINRYQHLNGPDLQGAARDASTLAETLREGGVNVHLLLDAAADKEAILGHLAKWRAEVGPDEDIFVHFSGYGGRSALDVPVLLPADARPDGSNDLTLRELSEALLVVPARSRLVTLDAGFAGAIQPSAKVLSPPRITNRFLPRSIPAHSRSVPALSRSVPAFSRGLNIDGRVLLPPFSLPIPESQPEDTHESRAGSATSPHVPPIVYITASGWDAPVAERGGRGLFSRDLNELFQRLGISLNAQGEEAIAQLIGALTTTEQGDQRVLSALPIDNSIWLSLQSAAQGKVLEVASSPQRYPRVFASEVSAVPALFGLSHISAWFSHAAQQMADAYQAQTADAADAPSREQVEALLRSLLREQIRQNLRDGRAVKLQAVAPLMLSSLNEIMNRHGLSPVPAGWSQAKALPPLALSEN